MLNWPIFFQGDPIVNLRIDVHLNVSHSANYHSANHVLAAFGDALSTSISMDGGSSIMLIVEYGDGDTYREFVSNWTSDNVIDTEHLYATIGEFNLTAAVKNSVNDSKKEVKVVVYDDVKHIAFSNDEPITTGPIEVKFTRTDTLTSTFGTALLLRYGDGETENVAHFHLPTTFNHTFTRAGNYRLRARFSNAISSAEISTVVLVVEKIANANVAINKGKKVMSIDQQLQVEFSASQGTNITIECDFGDGSTETSDGKCE